MKKNLLIIFSSAILGLFSCAQKSQGGKFEITGKAKNIHSNKIYLKQVDFTNNMPIILDSSAIKTDGSFTLKSDVKGQHLFFLSAENEAPFLLINDNSSMQVQLDGQDPLHPSYNGTDATTQLYTFINKYREKDSVTSNTFELLDSLSKIATPTHAQDSLLTLTNKQKDLQLKDMNGLIESFVKENNNPIAVFYVLKVMASRSIEPSDLLVLAQNASNRFKDDGSLAGLVSKLKVDQASDDPNNYPLLNQPAPDLAMQTPEGKAMKISDFKGKYLLVDFWASWCGPCRGENPNVVKAYNQFKNKNFTILGVSLDKDKDAWMKAIKDDGLAWNHMSDLKYWESDAVKAYQFNGIPFNVLLDPTGKIIANNLRGDDLEKKLAEVLK